MILNPALTPFLHKWAQQFSSFSCIALLAFAGLLASCDSGSTGDQSGGGEDSPQPGVDEPEETFRSTGLVINELMASLFATKDAMHRDEGGQLQPWLELYNGSGATVDLGGYRLTTRGIEDASWTLPNVEIRAEEFLRIWGSGFNRTVDPNALHTGFSLMGSDVLSLIHPDGSVLDRIEDVALPRDEAWSRFPDGADAVTFNSNPSPGRANSSGNAAFSLNCDYMTLTAGTEFQLKTSPATTVLWTSSDPELTVSDDGVMSTTASGIAGEQTPFIVRAIDAQGFSRQCQVAVVNWVANRSSLEVVGFPQADFLLGYFDNRVHFTMPRELHKADDRFENASKFAEFPASSASPLLLKSPNGYFASAGGSVYSSQDLRAWRRDFTQRHGPLQHGFAQYFDAPNSTNYLYLGDYSVQTREPHAVYRGINTGANTQWETVLAWQPEQYFYNDNSRLNTIRHVHAVLADPYTGHVWVATGDIDQHSRLYVSEDQGQSFKQVAIGSQKFRSLSLWFTERYVYWNMDSERANQKVFRLPRTAYAENNTWPSLTPELDGGVTTVGVRYLVSATDGNNFPVQTGRFYIETQSRSLSRSERVFPIEDPAHDYSELVADLTHSAQWNHLWVKDQNDEDVLVMSTSVESTLTRLRDFNSRVFGFKERADGSVDVQELLNFPSPTPNTPIRYSQLIPGLQDGEGYIYMRGRETSQRIYKMRLHWVDSPG